jgi:hypothetical protein
MGKTDRIYLKFEGIDWDDDEAIDELAKSLHGALVERLDSNNHIKLNRFKSKGTSDEGLSIN